MACDKEWIAAAEYRKVFQKMFHQETSEVTNDFNHPSEDYVNRISTDLSAQMISTQNDGQNSSR